MGVLLYIITNLEIGFASWRVTFLLQRKKVTKKRRPNLVCPSGTRALLTYKLGSTEQELRCEISMPGRFDSLPCSTKLNSPSMANLPYRSTMHGKRQRGLKSL